jgi:pimeloyl-ACP methyl ester carboxylesterase
MKRVILNNGQAVACYFTGDWAAQTPLVLLHGFCEDASIWDNLLPLLGEVPVVRIDLPGFGQSDLPGQPTIESYAEAVAGALQQLGVTTGLMVGHSLGGYVALAFAAAYPERLAGLGLFHSHPFADNEARQQARVRGIDMLAAGKRDLYVAQLFPNLFPPEYVQNNPEIIQKLIKNGQQQSAEGISTALLAMKNRPDHQPTLQQYTRPVLLLLGAIDQLVPLEQAWQMAMLPRQVSVEILPEVAHMGMFEAPEACAKILRAFTRWAG